MQQQMIDRRLKQIETNLKQDEKTVINDLFNDYHLTKDQRQSIEAKIDEQKQFEKEYMSRPHKKVGHVNVKPEHMEIYQATGIHPQSVKLTRSDLDYYSGEAIPMATGPSTNPLKKRTVISPPETQLSTFLSPSQETGVLAHEMTHHALHHVSTIYSLRDNIAAVTGLTPEEVWNNKNIGKLITIQERQAEILHKTPQLAETMRIKRNSGYYPNHLFLGHYGQLTEIDELHKLKDKLENYKPEPVQPRIDTLNTIKFNAPAPLLQSQPHQSHQKPKVVPVRQISADAQLQATE